MDGNPSILSRSWNSAPALLLMTGALLGLAAPLNKLAGGNGVPPWLWACVISFGAGTVLLAASARPGHRFPLDWRRRRYFIIAAVVSYALPNLLMFSAIPH